MERLERVFLNGLLKPEGLRDGAVARVKYRRILEDERRIARDVAEAVVVPFFGRDVEDGDLEKVRVVFDTKVVMVYGQPGFVYSVGFLREEVGLEDAWLSEKHGDMVNVRPRIESFEIIGTARRKAEVFIDLFWWRWAVGDE